MPVISFDTPENIRKPEVFWCFQWVSKEISGLKWVNKLSLTLKFTSSREVSVSFWKQKLVCWYVQFFNFRVTVNCKIWLICWRFYVISAATSRVYVTYLLCKKVYCLNYLLSQFSLLNIKAYFLKWPPSLHCFYLTTSL